MPGPLSVYGGIDNRQRHVTVTYMDRIELSVRNARATGAMSRRVTIAATASLEDGTVDLANMQFDRYMRNPVVLYQHGRASDAVIPVGRTLKIERVQDNGEIAWEAEFEFLTNDPFASRVRNAWDKGALNAASIKWDVQKDGRPELIEWSIVPVGMDPEAVKRAYARSIEVLLDAETPAPKDKETDMTMDAEAVKNAVAEGVKVGIASTEEARSEAVKKQVNEIMERAKKEAGTGGDPSEDPPETPEARAEEIEKRAGARAALLTKADSLLPDSFDPGGKSDRDIMLAAIGDSIKEPGERSDGYLEATLDGLATSRSAAASQRNQRVASAGNGGQRSRTDPEEFGTILRERTMPQEDLRTRAMAEQQAQRDNAYRDSGGR